MNKKNSVLGVVALCGALALSGCGAAEVNSASTGEPDPSAELTIGVNVTETSWDPAKAIGSAGLPVMKLVFDGLLGLDAGGNVAPELATSWETADGGKTYTFTLREDATFSNGDSFDATDAQVTLERYQTLETSAVKPVLANVDEIKVESPTELTIVQKTADVTLPVLLADRAGVMMSEEAIAEGDLENPAGSGMFLLDANQPGVSASFKANPDHWDADAVKVAGVTVKKMEDETARTNALRSGDLDLSIVSASRVTEIEGATNLASYRIKGRALRGLTFNPDLYEPLADQRVRDALSIAINREGLATGILFGEGEPASQFVREEHKFYNTAAPKIEHNPERARELLKEAGHESGLAFTMTAPPKYQKEAEAVQADWAAIGVDVQLTFPTGTGNAEKIWYNKEVPVGLWAFEGRNDLGVFYSVLFDQDSVFNPSGEEDPKMAAWIAEANATPDEPGRKAAFDEIAELVAAKTQNQAPLVFGYDLVAYSKDLTGVQEWEGGFPYIKGVGKSR